MADFTAMDVFRLVGTMVDRLLDLPDIVSLMTCCKVIYDNPSEAAEALLIFKGLHELCNPLVQRMLARGMRPLNVDRARNVMQIQKTLQKWSGGPGQILPPINSGVMITMKEYVWRYAASVTLTNMVSHLHATRKLYEEEVAYWNRTQEQYLI